MTQAPRIPITVLVQTKNEAVGIGACLRGLGDFDEVVVVDSHSEDDTREIAAQHGARVELFKWDGKYPKKKQWQLDNLRVANEWVLFMDADESPTGPLIAELRTLFGAGVPEHDAYDIDLDYVFAGRLLKHGHRVTKRCLVKTGRVRFPEMDDLDAPGMGELEGHYQPVVDGTVGKLRGRILHNDLDPVASWFSRHNRYSDWEAHLRRDRRARQDIASKRTRKGQIFDAVPLKPLAFFVYCYIVRAGFLDGRAGLDYAIALAMYYWQIGVKTRELERSGIALSSPATQRTRGGAR